jgi:hypothetical protein
LDKQSKILLEKIGEIKDEQAKSILKVSVNHLTDVAILYLVKIIKEAEHGR